MLVYRKQSELAHWWVKWNERKNSLELNENRKRLPLVNIFKLHIWNTFFISIYRYKLVLVYLLQWICRICLGLSVSLPGCHKFFSCLSCWIHQLLYGCFYRHLLSIERQKKKRNVNQTNRTTCNINWYKINNRMLKERTRTIVRMNAFTNNSISLSISNRNRNRHTHRQTDRQSQTWICSFKLHTFKINLRAYMVQWSIRWLWNCNAHF